MVALEEIYAWLIVSLSCVGLLVNGLALGLLSRKKHRKSLFHDVLKILAVYDIFVMLGCTSLYALPELSGYYRFRIYPHLLKRFLPFVQIAMMTSIYCTILMSLERYIRICHLCQLKYSRILTEENYWKYMVGFVVVPFIFYLPKFFEIELINEVSQRNIVINCSDYGYELKFQSNIESYNNNNSLFVDDVIDARNVSFPRICTDYEFDLHSDNETFIRIFTQKREHLVAKPTWLRKNKLYFKIYYIIGNITFASIVPIISLIYLNICTVLALRKMGHGMQDCEIPSNVTTTPKIEHNNIFRRKINSHRTSQPSVVSDSQIPNSIKRDTEVVLNKNFSSARVVSMSPRPSNPTSAAAQLFQQKNDIEEPLSVPDISVSEIVDGNEEDLDCELARNLSSAGSISGQDNHQQQFKLPTVNNRRSFRFFTSKSKVSRNSDAILGQRHSSTSVMRRQENRLTRISISIVSLFIACHIWRLILSLYESFFVLCDKELQVWPNWMVHVNHISHTLIVFNSAVNFLLYIMW